MGEEELDLGNPQLYLMEEHPRMSGDGVIVDLKDTDIPFKVIGMDSEWNEEVPTPKSIECSVTIPRTDYDRMMFHFAIGMAHHEAERLNSWIKECIVGSRLPRKKKKWCKKEIAKVLSGAYPCRHILKYIKAKKQ